MDSLCFVKGQHVVQSVCVNCQGIFVSLTTWS